MLELASLETRISVEGDLASCKFPGDAVMARDEQDRLKRNTIFPRQDFVVLRLTPELVDRVFEEIAAAGLERAVCHVQIDSRGELQLGAYDCFQHVLVGPLVTGRLARWKEEGLISWYENDTEAGQGVIPYGPPPAKRPVQRLVAIVLVLIAAGIGCSVVSQAMQTDDGGPPMAALCMALPAFFLLIAAGVLWSWRSGRR